MPCDRSRWRKFEAAALGRLFVFASFVPNLNRVASEIVIQPWFLRDAEERLRNLLLQ